MVFYQVFYDLILTIINISIRIFAKRKVILMSKEENVIRKGWKDWHVKMERIESVAEYI